MMIQPVNSVVYRKFTLGIPKEHIEELISHLSEQLKFRDPFIRWTIQRHIVCTDRGLNVVIFK